MKRITLLFALIAIAIANVCADNGDISTLYDLWVCGEQVTDANKNNLANGTVTFDGDHTLTLNNATIDVTKDLDGGIVSKMHDLTIHLEGDNTLNCQAQAIQMNCAEIYQTEGYGQLTIEGPGSLTINSAEEDKVSGIGLFAAHCTFRNCGDVEIRAGVCVSGFVAFIASLLGSEEADAETLTVENTNLCMYSYDQQTVVLKSVNYVDTDLRLPREGFFSFPFFKVMEGEEQASPSNVVISKTGKGLAIDEVDVPDGIFRSILSEMRQADFYFMTDNELTTIKSLWLNEKGIASLKGIEHFTSLESLNAAKNQLTELELPEMTRLKTLDVSENQLTELILPAMPRLEHLNCFDNQLTSLDVSGCEKISYIYCYHNQISGEETDKLVASLHPFTDGLGTLAFYSAKMNDTEQNVINARQVVEANDKNWVVQALTVFGFITYAGQPVEGFEAYDCYIGDRRVTSDNNSDLSPLFTSAGFNVDEGTVYYTPDEEAPTLVLDHATISPVDAEQQEMVYVGSVKGYNVNVMGTNTLNSVAMNTGNGFLKFIGEGNLSMSGFSGLEFVEYDDIVQSSLTVDGPKVSILSDLENACYSEVPLKFNIVKGSLTMSNNSTETPVVFGMQTLSVGGNTTISQPEGALLGVFPGGWSVVLDNSPVCGQTVIFTDGSTPTAISQSVYDASPMHQQVYDLQGRCIGNLAPSHLRTFAPSIKKGLYIIGTRKVVIK